MMVELSQSMTA